MATSSKEAQQEERQQSLKQEEGSNPSHIWEHQDILQQSVQRTLTRQVLKGRHVLGFVSVKGRLDVLQPHLDQQHGPGPHRKSRTETGFSSGQVRLAYRDLQANRQAIDTPYRALDLTTPVMPTVKQKGPPPRESNNHTQRYHVSAHASKSSRGSLIDRGANGGIIGNDARITLQHQREVDVTGIDNHELNALKIVDAAARVITQHGPAIVIMRQYAFHGIGRTIHSAGQFEHYKNMVDDRSMKAGGKQCTHTKDGYVTPLDIINGLPCMKMEPHSDQEWNDLPHVILTAGDQWDPRVLDHSLTEQEDWYNIIKQLDGGLLKTPFDEFGNYRKRQVPTHTTQLAPIEIE